MPTYIYWCNSCQHVTDLFRRLTEERPETYECENCGSEAEYRLAAPMVLRASYLDGQKRKGFQDLKEASKLNMESIREQNPESKKEIEKEIRKTGFDIRRDGLNDQ